MEGERVVPLDVCSFTLFCTGIQEYMYILFQAFPVKKGIALSRGTYKTVVTDGLS